MSTNPPTRADRLFLLWIGLGVGALLLLLLAAAGLVFWLATEAMRPAPLPEGVTAEVECLDPCLTVDDAATLVPRAIDLYVGSDVVIEPDLAPVSALSLFDDVHEEFYLGGGTPINCDFSMGRTTGFSDSNYYAGDDLAIDLGAYGGTATLSQTVRIFDSSLNAARYPTFLSSVVTRCPHYSVDSATRGAWETDVIPLDLPVADGVAVVAWTEQSSGLAVSTADLQYGTLVLRTTYTRPVAEAEIASVEDDAFAAFVLLTSERLADLG